MTSLLFGGSASISVEGVMQAMHGDPRLLSIAADVLYPGASMAQIVVSAGLAPSKSMHVFLSLVLILMSHAILI